MVATHIEAEIHRNNLGNLFDERDDDGKRFDAEFDATDYVPPEIEKIRAARARSRANRTSGASVEAEAEQPGFFRKGWNWMSNCFSSKEPAEQPAEQPGGTEKSTGKSDEAKEPAKQSGEAGKSAEEQGGNPGFFRRGWNWMSNCFSSKKPTKQPDGTEKSTEQSGEAEKSAEEQGEKPGFFRRVWNGVCGCFSSKKTAEQPDGTERSTEQPSKAEEPAKQPDGTEKSMEQPGKAEEPAKQPDGTEEPVEQSGEAEQPGFFRKVWNGVCGWFSSEKPAEQPDGTEKSTEQPGKAEEPAEKPDGTEEPAEQSGEAEQPGFFRKVWNGVCGWFSSEKSAEQPDGTEQPGKAEEPAEKPVEAEELVEKLAEKLSEAEELEAEALSNLDKLYRDFGLIDANTSYDRNFLSDNRGDGSSTKFFRMCKDPSLLFMFVLLKLREYGDENCESALKAWLKKNEEANILAKKRLGVQNENAQLARSLADGWRAYGNIAIGTAASVAGMFGMGQGVHQVGTAVMGILNAKVQFEIEQNKATIDAQSSEMNSKREEASMHAQDMSRLFQTQATLSSLSQAVMQERKDRLSAIRI
ncbi:MAG: hypothetical protein LBJ94_00940 [Puniceicoccales bacterium]|jgi:hypothetical protein|nr:hypothetical protein [Puniceicoccales bacterium]